MFFRDRDITRLSLHQTSRLGITKTYQITHIFPDLTVFENVRIAAQSRHSAFNFWRTTHSFSSLNERTLDILEQVELLEKRSWLASTLSHGERRYLEIGIALATEPEVLLLDEPTAGMSVRRNRLCAELIKRLNQELNLSIVLVEHDMSVVMGISDEILVLNEGEGPRGRDAAGGERQREVQRVYLGEEKICLAFEKVNTYYGYSHILHDISLEVKEGEIVVLLGRNGVGKTTTMKTIMGVQPPKSGKVVFRGEEIAGPARPTGSPGRGSPSSPRTGGSSPTSPCTRT